VVGRNCVNPDHDEDCDGDHDDGRLPADQDPNLPEWAKGKYYFGAPSVYDGFVYESQPAYLARLKLLTRDESAILRTRYSGKPWTRTGLDGIPGDGDVYGLISGHFFFPSYCSPEDEESQRVLWDELKEERSTAKSRASEFHRAYSDNAHRVGKLRMSSQRRSIST
jgi:hypothetical protein